MTEILDQAANLEINNFTDSDGNPRGGDVKGLGIAIEWQNGPRREIVDGVPGEMKEPNGAFVEHAIIAAKTRLEFFQTAGDGRFACAENQEAIDALGVALAALHRRTEDRQARGVEGMNEK